MTAPEPTHETAKWRTLWLLAGFVLLVAIAVVTIVRPELEDKPEDAPASEVVPVDDSHTGTQVQE